jgi:hypothetical protein
VWFLIISNGILLTEYLKIDFKKTNLMYRLIIHQVYLIGTFILTIFIDLSVG